MDEELSLLDMHTWQGGTDAWLDQVGLLLSWVASLVCVADKLRGVFCDDDSLWTLD